MEIRQLKTFIGIVKLGSFSQAAQFLGYTQSTVTTHIQLLEKEFNTVLFERFGHSLMLTTEGEKLYDYAEQIVYLAEKTENALSNFVVPRGSLVLTGEPAWWLLAGDLTALPAIRRHLAAVAPGTPVDVLLVSDDAADEQDLVSPGQLHLRWVHPEPGSRPGEVGVLLDALAQIPARAGDGFAFIAAEQSVVAPGRALLTARGVDLERAVVKGYWKRSPSTATSGQGLVIR